MARDEYCKYKELGIGERNRPCEMQTQQLVCQKQEFPPAELLIFAVAECESKDQKISYEDLADLQCEAAFAQASPSCWQYLLHENTHERWEPCIFQKLWHGVPYNLVPPMDAYTLAK